MGLKKLDAKSLQPYPNGIGRESEHWPKDPRTGRPYLRFRWSRNAEDDVNSSGLDDIFASIRATGAARVADAVPELRRICDRDLKVKIKAKFIYMAREFRKSERQAAEHENIEAAAEEEVEEEEEEEAEEAGADGEHQARGTRQKATEPVIEVDRAHKNSCVASKLQGRVRKRQNSIYTDKKYDSAFMINAMSDDEDDPTWSHGEVKRYISRAPGYRSETVKQLYISIDAIADKDPDKAKAATTRIRGPEYPDAVRPKAKKLANRIRAWQVNDVLLAENQHWLTSGRVAISGWLWGDDEDPEDSELKRKSVEAGERNGKKRRRVVDSSAVAQAQSRVEALTNGGDINQLFAGLG
ncbi:hypothetical protein SCP_0803770 [Sparassis crispa]|uniref:Uncharacterized protein n=1 Tax=Sparassis crispa TaxID=139825 RepID=A0A401GUE0_9APHY|nr:hypothetical protein SCP_0803770 [Sparassis crispa]GBE85855.1 hypothetical protein SCP_0803770 [Sparassis crispa]